MVTNSQYKLYLASANPHKLAEFQGMLGSSPIIVMSAGELGDIHWEETGTSFQENALIKVKALAAHTKHPILADDSGLVVPALQGQPGVYSSRFAGEDASDQDNMDKLLEMMKDLDGLERRAYFSCVLCYRDSRHNDYYFEGRCSGSIVREGRGLQGFGYDPIFQADGFEKTLAELDSTVKNQMSHRRKALDQWLSQLDLSKGL